MANGYSKQIQLQFTTKGVYPTLYKFQIVMAETEIKNAVKYAAAAKPLKNSGKKEYKACVFAGGAFPYLPVLDDILSRENIQNKIQYGADASSQAVGGG